MKRGLRWGVALLVVLVIGFGVVSALSKRKAQQQALTAASSAEKTQNLIELAASDVMKAQTRELSQGIAVSGTLKAVNSAQIKARVAGELQGLTLREGDFVKAGQVVARIEAGEYQSRVRQAREQAESARAQVDVVQRQYDNNKALVDQGFISKTALDTSLANLNAAQSTFKAAQAATEVAAKSLDDTVLKSPIAGQISQRFAQPGERLGIDAKIVEVVDLSRLEMEATLTAADAMDVRVGQTALLRIEGNPNAQAGSRSVLAYLSVDNNGGPQALPLRQGLFVQGTLGTARSALLSVPASSVRSDKPVPYVQAIEDGKVVHKAVETGIRGLADGEPMVAVKGLAEGALLIRGDIGALREGTAVRFTATPASVAAAAPASAASAAGKSAP
jgi:multidrug efflux system membrane fusion protein